MVHGNFSESEHNLHVGHVLTVLLEKEDHVRSILAVHKSHVDFVEVRDVVVIIVCVPTLVDRSHLSGTHQVHSLEVNGL